MFWELLATAFAGLGAAGVVLAARRFSGKRVPAWTVPAVAGSAMLAFQIYSEYTWFSHQRSLLPDDVQVVRHVEESAAWRPWTLIFPQTVRFIAVGKGAVNKVNRELVLADVFLFERRLSARQVPQIFHCGANARANLSDALVIPAPGAPLDDQWTPLGADDALLQAVCGNAVAEKTLDPV